MFRHFLSGGIGILSLLFSACSVVPQPTVTPTATDRPTTRTPTEIYTSPTPTITPFHVIEGICANVLYPMLPGSEWIYQTITPDGPRHLIFQVTGVQNDLANLLFIDQQADIATDDTVRCTNGTVDNLPLVYISLLLSDYLDGVLNTYQVSGITAPNLALFEENNWQYSWEYEKLVEQSVKVQAPGLEVGFIMRSNLIIFHSETSATWESVTVPAGNFPHALLVKVEMRSPVTVKNTSANLTIKYREWYEPFVGMLKIQIDSASLDYSGFPIPFTLDNKLELVEYKIPVP